MNSISKKVGWFAPTNMALAKYWGKRDLSLNLPSNSSLSLTLDHLGTKTWASINANSSPELIFFLNGKLVEPSERLKKIYRFFFQKKPLEARVIINTENNIPTAAGFASSASGLAAFVLCLNDLFETHLSSNELSQLMRQGSGSACRSQYGGTVLWHQGSDPKGTDSISEQIFPEDHWPLDLFFLSVKDDVKEISSTQGMEHTRKTSPYFQAWTETAEKSVKKIIQFIDQKDFSSLSQEVESNCLRFHACAMAADPGILYWSSDTIALMHSIRRYRLKENLSVCFTIDAGPNVVAIVSPESTPSFLKLIQSDFPELKILTSKIGSGPNRL